MANPYASLLDLADRYDVRTVYELSNDANVPDVEFRRVNRLLDAAAAELESTLYGFWALPLVINAGSITNAVAVNATTFVCSQIPGGVYVGQRIVVGPDASSAPASANPPEIVQIESISGSAPTITVTITGSGQSQAGQSGGFSFAHNANAPIGTVPLVCTDYVCAMAAHTLFGRRAKRPEGLDADVKDKRQWIEDLRSGLASIPGIDRSIQPQIYGCDGVAWQTPAVGCQPFSYAWPASPGWWSGLGW